MMADNTQFDFRLLESLRTALLCKIEEELISMTYGATRLLKQGLETQRQFQSPNSDWSSSDRSNNFDQIANYISELFSQLEQRGRAVYAESVNQVEAKRPHLNDSESTAGALDIRLKAIEDSLDSIDLLASEVGQSNDSYASLSDRISKLEQLLQNMSNVQELLGYQSQAISSLEERLTRLELAQPTDKDISVHAVEPDRFI